MMDLTHIFKIEKQNLYQASEEKDVKVQSRKHFPIK